MADITKMQLDGAGTAHDIKDATAREQISDVKEDVSSLNTNMSSVTSEISTLKETVNNLSQSSGSTDIFESLNQYPAAKNSIARGKNIQEYFDDGSLYTRIKDNYDDLFIGDYFRASYNSRTYTFVIADYKLPFNVYDSSSTVYNYNYLILVPITTMDVNGTKEFPMNESNTTETGYYKSYMNKTVIGPVTSEANTTTVNGILYGIFGSHLMKTYEYLSSSAITLTGSIYSALHNSEYYQAVIMSERELCGSTSMTTNYLADISAVPMLKIFDMNPNLYNNTSFWLRDIFNTTSFARIYYKTLTQNNAANTDGVIPRFIIA